MLKVEGKTEEGRLVVSGVFRFYETHGVPLDVLFDVLEQHLVTPDWVSLYHEARRAGLKLTRILAVLNDSVCDVYGPEYRDVVLDRLGKYHDFVEESEQGGA